MLTPSELEAMPLEVEKLFRDFEYRVMSDVVRRLKNNGNEIIRSADWQIYRLTELGKSEKEIKTFIQNSLNLTDKEIDVIYDNALNSGYAHNSEIYKSVGTSLVPYSENEGIQQLVSVLKEQTSGEFKNITNSMGFAVKGADGKMSFTPIADYYQKALDGAMIDIASGAFDYNTVLKRIVAEMTNSGLRTVDYASGWSNRVDVAARRAVITGISQLTGKINEQTADELETDTFEVSYHIGARPSHQIWQGKWYTYEDLVSVCGLGSVTGLCGANCRHSYSPVIPGVSVPTYTEEELKRMNEQENTPKDYYGKKYTAYEATQRQRYLETAMRAQRQKIKLLQDGGADEDDIINARARYRGLSQEYAQFSKAMDLPQQRERIYGDGLGNVGKGKWKLKNETEIRTKADYQNIELTKVNWDSVDSGKWHDNFNKITDNNIVNNSIRTVSEQILKNRDGTFYESMYLINAKTGNIEGFNTTSNVKLKVALTDKMKEALNNPDLDLIGIHNHPYSHIPSVADLNAIANRSNQSMGVVVCHDGTIFTYTRPNAKIREQDYKNALTKHKKYSKITNENKGFEDLGNFFDFEFRRIEV